MRSIEDRRGIRKRKRKEGERKNAEVSKSRQTRGTTNNTDLQSQIFNRLSLPPVTSRRFAPGSGLLLTKLPGAAAGAQLTELTPDP